jgi:hypothetical protein
MVDYKLLMLKAGKCKVTDKVSTDKSVVKVVEEWGFGNVRVMIWLWA